MMSTESSRTATLTSQRSWKNSLRRFVSPLNGSTLTRSFKGSLKGWRSDASIHTKLLSKSLRKSHLSSPNMQGLQPPVVIPMVHYDRATSSVSLSDGGKQQFDVERDDSEYGSAQETWNDSLHSGALRSAVTESSSPTEHAPGPEHAAEVDVF